MIDYEAWAHLYDGLVQDDHDIAYFVRLAQTAGVTRVMELMAGTGRVALGVATTGVAMTCVDRSPAMLEVFRARLRMTELVMTLVEQDVAELNLAERFPLIYIAFNSFEEILEDDLRLRTMARVRDHLEPDGLAVITLHNPDGEPSLHETERERRLERTFMDPCSERRVRFRHQARPDRELMVGTQLFEYLDTGETIGPLPVRYRPTGRAEFAALVQQAGLRVEALRGDYQGAAFDESRSAQMIWELRRAGGTMMQPGDPARATREALFRHHTLLRAVIEAGLEGRGGRVIEEALGRGLEPHWNAHKPISKRLARRLGFVDAGLCEILALDLTD